MNKHELLVPAGNMECLKQAVFNGCDAVYLACKNFGARKFANNFTNEEIITAIKFCHLYGVKVFVTMNTLVKNDEVDAFLEQAYFLHRNGVDALIVQDFGMICLLRKKYPNLEIHASTQANVCSKDVCKLYYDLGVKRVVFARELSIDEIDDIDVPIEKEAFIHGALCISYSGCCLMSSMLGGRSGNRGECAGCCRMPFSLVEEDKVISNNKYLLSTKELNTSEYIDRLLDSSIYSFKIEGRMKSPIYVGFVTRLYRRLIDREVFDLKEEIKKLMTIYNREFTSGRLFNASDSELMNIKSPNHIGLQIGKVIDVKNNKIKIELDSGNVLNQYDAIRFLNSNKGFIVNFLYDNKMNLVNSSNSICYVDNKVDLKENDIVCKTQDYLLEKEFENVDKKKIPISFNVYAKLGKNLKISISDGINEFSSDIDAVQSALNAPTTKESIIKQLSKLGDTPFICDSFNIDMDDNIFIQIKILNDIRRDLVGKLIDLRENKKCEVIENDVSFDYENLNNNTLKSCSIYNEEQLIACLELFDRIYVNDINLYKKYESNEKVYYVYPRCSYDKTFLSRNLISDYVDFKSSKFVGNYSLNVTNIYTAYYLKKLGLDVITLSVELTKDELIQFYNEYKKKFGGCSFEILCYGLIENMIIKGNILNLKPNCYNYQIIDFKNRKFNVYYDGINTHILNYECRNYDKDLLKKYFSLRYDFFNENSTLIFNAVNK